LFEQFVAIDAPLQANRVQAHVFHIAQIRIQLFRHRRRNISAPMRRHESESPAIYFEQAMPFVGEFARDLPNPKGKPSPNRKCRCLHGLG